MPKKKSEPKNGERPEDPPLRRRPKQSLSRKAGTLSEAAEAKAGQPRRGLPRHKTGSGIQNEDPRRARQSVEASQAGERQAALTAGLHAVVAMADELIACPDLDMVYRKAVELARERLGIERCSIFLEEGDHYRGTYGTDRCGLTTAEHTDCFPVGQSPWRHILDTIRPEDPRWTVVEDHHTEWNGNGAVAFGHGWVAVTLVQSQFTGKPVGVFFNDAAITGAPVDKVKQEVLAVYCSLLGNIIERRRAQEKQAALTAGLRAVVAATDELIACPDLDTFYRRAVELAREKLGIERCAIFLERGGCFCGTYGTDTQGRTTDEHANSVVTDAPPWRKNLQTLAPEDRRWTVVEEPYWEWNGARSNIVGRGWVAVAPIQSRFAEKPIGVFVNDTAITGAPLDEVKQDILAVYCSLLGNIVERKRAVENLRHSEEQFRSLIENTSDIVAILSATGTIRYVSPSVERVLGYRPQELTDRTITEFADPDSTLFLADELARIAQAEHDVHRISIRARHKNGSYRLMESLGKALASGSYAGNIVVTARDITDQVELEEELRQSQKMEAVGRLAGGVAHDFNNLLTAIIGYSDLLLDRMDEENPWRREMEEIRKAGERAADLTDQLLAFSRRQMLQPTVLDLNVTVAELGKMLQRLIGENIEFVTSLQPGLGMVRADAGQISQVIVNLAVNARDAMPRGGKLLIETANVTLDAASAQAHADVPSGPYVMVAVSDTGCGMDAETRAHIFEPFFTTKQRGQGTGLGLSTTYGIVKQSGGHISVYSEAGHGTAFRIYLPRLEGVTAPDEVQEFPPECSGGTETILLVEDDELVRQLVRNVLTSKRYTVLETCCGDEALELVERHQAPIHLLLTDIVIPGMSGTELADRLAPKRPDMKVLYMSGYTENSVIHRRVLEKGVAFLQKPLAPEMLARKVREVLDHPQTKPETQQADSAPRANA